MKDTSCGDRSTSIRVRHEVLLDGGGCARAKLTFEKRFLFFQAFMMGSKIMNSQWGVYPIPAPSGISSTYLPHHQLQTDWFCETP
jgi:hypothetical protein